MEICNHCNGEGYESFVEDFREFRAAESMMSGWELYQSYVYDYAEKYHHQLAKMDFEDQDLLIAWHNQILDDLCRNPPAVNFVPRVTYQEDLYQVDNDEIPF